MNRRGKRLAFTVAATGLAAVAGLGTVYRRAHLARAAIVYREETGTVAATTPAAKATPAAAS